MHRTNFLRAATSTEILGAKLKSGIFTSCLQKKWLKISEQGLMKPKRKGAAESDTTQFSPQKVQPELNQDPTQQNTYQHKEKSVGLCAKGCF